jgi:hypothetical protein
MSMRPAKATLRRLAADPVSARDAGAVAKLVPVCGDGLVGARKSAAVVGGDPGACPPEGPIGTSAVDVVEMVDEVVVARVVEVGWTVVVVDATVVVDDGPHEEKTRAVPE